MGLFSRIPESVAFPVLFYGGIGLAIAVLGGIGVAVWWSLK